MEHRHCLLRISALAVTLCLTLMAFAGEPPQPAAALGVSTLLLPQPRPGDPASAVFLSENTIGVGPCPSAGYATCSLAVVRWENGSLQPTKETAQTTPQVGRTSASGHRRLFDFSDRQVPFLQHALETLRAILTLGMSGPEDVNREVVQVVDTSTSKACFEWSRSFPSTYERTRSASISPSGEDVAILVGTKLSVYRVPAVCEGPKRKAPPS